MDGCREVHYWIYLGETLNGFVKMVDGFMVDGMLNDGWIWKDGWVDS